MKKILFTLVCLLGIGMAASAFNNSAVVLLHNGNATTYEANQINDAMEAAQDGDVVMLSEGTYPAFDITKKITIKGVGQTTIIGGDVNIAIPNEPTLNANLMEFLTVTGYVYVKEPVNRMVIKQCVFDYYNSNGSGHGFWVKAKVTDSYIDRCKIDALWIDECYQETITVNGNTSTIATPYVQGLTISNSIITRAIGVSCGPSNYDYYISTGATFLNCYIRTGSHSLGKVINSIIKDNASSYWFQCTDFVNTFLRKNKTSYNPVNCTLTNCYLDDDTDLNYDSDAIAANGYLGNDGTIIGPLGGNTPYTLEPAVPTVTESSMKVDTDKQQLQVTLTVSPK